MPEKDPANYPIITYVWVMALSAWGGVVGYIRKVKNGDVKQYSFMELIGEVVTSAFAGVLTFLGCESAEVAPLITAALVGISGHMGSNAIYQFELWAKRKLK